MTNGTGINVNNASFGLIHTSIAPTPISWAIWSKNPPVIWYISPCIASLSCATRPSIEPT